ncbi:MAG: putative glycosidase [Acidimicrobiales bacterium]|nr:putative glycosidase [Acidimicrobiales bacterium]
MELGGSWQAIEADEDLRRTWLDEGPADAGARAWSPVAVPGHWRSSERFATADGPLLYRNRFEHEPPAAGERWWLRFDGLFYQGDVWLDGGYVGDTEGYFFPHTFEITEALGQRREYTLGVEVTCSPPSDRTAKRAITGAFQHGHSGDPDANPGGIWRPVTLERTGPVRIRHLRVLCREANQTRSNVAFRAVLDATEAGEVTLRSTVGDTEVVDVRRLAAGENQVEWTLRVDDPVLWWTHALGEPALHDVVVEVTPHPEGVAELPADTPVSHRVTRRIGLRQVHMAGWILSINGERLFLKGANQGPTRMALAEATPEELVRDVTLAKEANLDLLRIHAHISRPELYDAADEAGMLLWQDFPLQWGYARTIRKQAQRQAREAVDLLGHHPSIAIWCGHNEPLALDIDPADAGDPTARLGRFVAAQELPTWNKSILDRSVKRAIEKADGTRPVIAHSGVLPHPPLLDGTDSHLSFGWYHGEERDLPGFARLVPRQVRFVSEFGAQAVPESDEFLEPERWPDLDWERLAHSHGLQKSVFDRRVPPADHPSFRSWRAATQAYQANLIRHHVESLRRLKYRPTGGFAQFCFADGHPAVSWSVLDHERVAKAGFAALRDACRPVIVVADRLPAELPVGSTHALDVHVVSDLRVPITDVEVSATLRWADGEQRWRFGGDIEADTVARVGTLPVEVPDCPGPMSLELTLRCPSLRDVTPGGGLGDLVDGRIVTVDHSRIVVR